MPYVHVRPLEPLLHKPPYLVVPQLDAIDAFVQAFLYFETEGDLIELMHTLIKHGFDTQKEEKLGKYQGSPMNAAAAYGRYDTMNLLKNFGGKITLSNSLFNTLTV